jgi:hypothetical protein
MRRIILLFAVLIVACTVSKAQFGISAKYQNNSTPGWDDVYDGRTNIESSSIEYGLNYWLRLKNKRVEFLPELTYSSLVDDYDQNGFAVELLQHKRTSYGFGINTHIYPLDFEGDCNCPTFSKDGNLVSKGFHWIINTSIINHNIENTFNVPDNGASDQLTIEEKNQITGRVGLGFGLDIGITELITIVPYGLYTRNFGLKAPNFVDHASTAEPISSSLNQLHFGLRLVLRPDYIKSNGGFRR